MADVKLELVNEAFKNLEKLQERFLNCERAYLAKYKEDNRTTKRKNTERSRSRLYVPLIKTTVLIIHSIFKTSFMSDRCPIEITRVGLKSDSDLTLQNALTAVLKNRWKKTEHRVGLSKAVLSALYLPLGITSLYYDGQEKKIRTRFIPINDLAFDKDASDINDIEYVAYKWHQSIREVKQKIKSKYYKQVEDEEAIYRAYSKDSSRIQMKDLYEKSYKDNKIVWKLKSFANDVLVREATFSRLPFHFGYCIEDMPRILEEDRENQNCVYGSCISEIAREIQEEYNIKRNQKIDITENQIDPLYIIDKEVGEIAISDISARKKYIRAQSIQGKSISDIIQPLPQPNAYPLSEEIAMLKNEYEVITGVNSVMTGQTSPSDRRAMGALQTVNASSSMRIESMMQTLMETMLSSYATHFVELIYKHTSDDDFIKITEDEELIAKIGDESFRRSNRLDFDVNIEFGTTISKEVKIGQLNSLLGVLAQNGIQSIEIVSGILKEILTLILGENAPLEMIDEYIAQMQAQQQAMAEQQAMQAQQEAQEQELSDEQKELANLAMGGV
ncbi:hypothetical protein CPIN18021_0261 [Campylobacter pinnipediorum subsp. caledonicus]|uniref:Bacteriophage head to tail connecting protein n=1 Tax=Campylobacter pinnipediorum subsp. caledonicus TaxID=1874362 RepID=A0A1S6U5R1_9BACT|nr:hypothetical protein [Campylobacter pinnipediorum]AQW87108.1 hypothetical protein CPIN18021_0261 [Campylobacter pinnipediorum subsp. caledonicus]